MDLSTQRSLYLTHNGAQVLKTRDGFQTGEAQTASRDFVNEGMSDTTISLDVVFVGDFFLRIGILWYSNHLTWPMWPTGLKNFWG